VRVRKLLEDDDAVEQKILSGVDLLLRNVDVALKVQLGDSDAHLVDVLGFQIEL